MKIYILFVFCLCLSTFSLATNDIFYPLGQHSHIENLESSIIIQFGNTEASKFLYERGIEHNGITGRFSSGNNNATTTKFESFICEMAIPLSEIPSENNTSYKCSRVISEKNI